MAFIGGAFYTLDGAETPRNVVAAPAVALEFGVEPTPVASHPEPVVAGEVARRESWRGRFSRPNPIEAQRAASREVAVVEVLPVVAEVAWAASVSVPPLAYDPLAVEEADIGWAVAAVPDGAADGQTAFTAELELAELDEVPIVVAAIEPVEHERPYHVVKGDTLVRIARREWQSDDERLLKLLMDTNPRLHKRRAGRILAGERLMIPDRATAERVLAGMPVRLPTSEAVASAEPAVQWYTVKENDSLSRIAQRELNDGRRWREILKLNKKLKADRIFPGTKIKIPGLASLVAG